MTISLQLNNAPPYFAQSHKYACSLAALRSILALKGFQVSEEDLIAKVELDYGRDFKSLWNPTIARLSCEYGIQTKMYARWPLFKPDKLNSALLDFREDPLNIDVRRYESSYDKDRGTQPLSLAYKEMFAALEQGCKVEYAGLTERRIEAILSKGHYIQTSIKTHVLYPGERTSFHSLLIFKYRGGVITYHDPARAQSMTCTAQALVKAANGTGAFIEYAM